MIDIKQFNFSSKGKQDINEDHIGILALENLGLYLICDGTSKYGHGKLAARVITTEIVNYINKNYKELQPKKLIQGAIHTANESIWNKRKELKSKFGGSIAGILFKDKKIIYAFWIGDARIYQIRNKQILFQSEDHSLSNYLKTIPSTTFSKINNYINITTASVSGKTIDKLSITKLHVLQGDTFLICSDGLWKDFPLQMENLANLNDVAFKNLLNDYSEHFTDNYSIIKLDF